MLQSAKACGTVQALRTLFTNSTRLGSEIDTSVDFPTYPLQTAHLLIRINYGQPFAGSGRLSSAPHEP